jgi:DNA-binding response OmpR family regulator
MEKDKILIIDDEKEILESLKEGLEANRFEVITAGDAEAGLGKALSEKPNLIVLDIMMPGVDGAKALQRLRAGDTTREIPVLMLTAKGESGSIEQFQTLGATDYFVKPVNLGELVKKIRKYLRLKEIGEI